MLRTIKHILLTFLCWLAVLLPQQADAGEVLIVNSSPRKPYQQAIDGLSQVLGGVSYQGVKTIQRLESEVFSADSIQNDSLFNRKIKQRQVQVLVAVGSKALKAVSDLPLPIVYLMVANPAKLVTDKKNITGVQLIVEPDKQLAAIAKELPSLKSLGILYDPRKSAAQITLLKRSAQKSDFLKLVVSEVGRPKAVNAALNEIGAAVDALLLVPDTTVLTATNLDILSLYSLNSRKPLIAFAPQYLKLGAAIVIYSTPNDMGQQAGHMVLRLLAGKSIAQIPQELAQSVTVATNRRILTKLGFTAAADSGNKNVEGRP